MQLYDTIKSAFWGWLDCVGEVMIMLAVRFTGKHIIRLVEGADGNLSVATAENGASNPRGTQLRIVNGNLTGRPSPYLEAALRGGRIELVLQPERFVFKSLELPSRASEFLAGVVRSQIDRLTPWSADTAAFGFSQPSDAGSGRILINVAATAREMVLPLLRAFTALGARSVAISAAVPDSAPTAPAITVLQANEGVLDVRFARRMLASVLGTALLIAVTADIAAGYINSKLQARQDELAHRIAQRRAAAFSVRNAPRDPKMLAERALAQRKNKSPSIVIALETLSQILPDNSYVTEMRVEADKLRLTGITRDAPQLIRLIEQTHHFSQASFFAPITRSSSEAGDRFNIEARMEPNYSLTP
jgi:general secretion pathway protein L